MTDRRQLLMGAGAVSLALAPLAAGATGKAAPARSKAGGARAFASKKGARSRLMMVNDLSGDADGLFAAVHALLSSSVEVRGIVGTAAQQPAETAQMSVQKADEILSLMGLSGKIPVHLGAGKRMASPTTPVDCAGARAIVAEAMRDDPLPLYIAVGGGLTEMASALLIEPKIAERCTLVWIGGGSHPEGSKWEYNFNLDRTAAQTVFNDTGVPIFQVTDKAYASCQVSNTELQAHVAPYGAIGAWLYERIVEGIADGPFSFVNPGETWTLGDSPLVLLTALTAVVPSTFSKPLRYERTGSPYREMFVPRLRNDGTYEPRSDGRRMRAYDTVDTRLMFGDFFAKLKMAYGP
jgi:purine nucleosidase